MDVSVIILTRNTCELTCAAVRSVMDSSDALAKEAIVMDNGSSDDTPSVLPARFPQVRYLRSEGNLGFARAVNHAARQATGKWLALLNSDARLEPHALAQAVAWLDAHPDCAVVAAQLFNPDGSRQNSIANFPTLATELLNKSLLRRLCPRRYPGKEHRFAGPTNVETVVGAFMLIRKDSWDALGGLDERYFFFFEETDFCLRVHRLGKQVTHLPGVGVRHDQGQTANQLSAEARIEYWRSRYAYFEKNHSRVECAILEAGLLVRLLIDWLAATFMAGITLGCVDRPRRKWRALSALWGWQLRGRPLSTGLPRPTF
jgi:GT2 family glycosyltransferase